MLAREAELVELVDDHGTVTGSATVLDAHESPGLLHRAFSVFLRDPSGRVLLQQRAAAKTRFPLRWGNTCCGHPGPGDDLTAAAGKRLAEELGITPVPLTEVGVYVYFAEDPVTGRVEREYDHVLLGDVPTGAEFRPDPGEVARLRWVTVADLRREIAGEPEAYAPWLAGVTERLAAHLPASPSALPADHAAPLAAFSPASSPAEDRAARPPVDDGLAAAPSADDRSERPAAAPEGPGGQ